MGANYNKTFGTITVERRAVKKKIMQYTGEGDKLFTNHYRG